MVLRIRFCLKVSIFTAILLVLRGLKIYSHHQLVSFRFDDSLLHYFCSYVTLRDGPASGKNMRLDLPYNKRFVLTKIAKHLN